MPRRRTRNYSTRPGDIVGSSSASDEELQATQNIINKLSDKYMGKKKTSSSKQCRRSVRISTKKQENDEYQADIENNTESSQSDSSSKSTSADLYDFNTSEEDLKLELSPEKSESKKSKVSKQASKKSSARSSGNKVTKLTPTLTESQKPNSVLYKLKGVGKPNKTEKKLVQSTSSGTKRLTDSSFKEPESLKKRKLTSETSVVFDSGVFMTPSPIQGSSSATFHLSFDKGKANLASTSTPSGVIAPFNSRKSYQTKPSVNKLGKPLAPPPNLSPVKNLVSPNTGGVHGALLTSPSDDVTPALSPIDFGSPRLKKKKTAHTDVFLQVEEDEEPFKALNISKTYDSFSDKPKITQKMNKSKKRGRYSVSKYEEWADQKATEFDEIEKFELSIESC